MVETRNAVPHRGSAFVPYGSEELLLKTMSASAKVSARARPSGLFFHLVRAPQPSELTPSRTGACDPGAMTCRSEISTTTSTVLSAYDTCVCVYLYLCIYIYNIDM